MVSPRRVTKPLSAIKGTSNESLVSSDSSLIIYFFYKNNLALVAYAVITQKVSSQFRDRRLRRLYMYFTISSRSQLLNTILMQIA